MIRELTGGMYFGEKYQDNDKAYDRICIPARKSSVS